MVGASVSLVQGAGQGPGSLAHYRENASVRLDPGFANTY